LFGAIGAFYGRFDQVSDDEVVMLMKTQPIPTGLPYGCAKRGENGTQ
jgi:predicted phosphoribosyltransferase